jgi:adenylate cyclase
MEFWLRLNASDHVGARELAEKAVEIDPNYAAAWALLAWTHHMAWRLGLGDDSAATFERAAALAEKAMALDDCNPYAIGISTSVVAASGRHDKGIEITSRGLDLLPGNADVRCYRSYALRYVANMKKLSKIFGRPWRLIRWRRIGI